MKVQKVLTKAGVIDWVVTPDIQAKIPQQFRSDANTTGNFFQPKGFWYGTQAQYTALAVKDPNTLYYISG